MKKSLFAAALAMAGTACWAQSEEGKKPLLLVDGVAAYVNDSTITIAESMGEVNRTIQRLKALNQWTAVTHEDEIKERMKLYDSTLDAMINQRLILDYAKKAKVQLQPWAVDARTRETIANHFDGDSTKFYDYLADIKLTTEEYKKRVEEDLILQAMRYQYVERRVTVTPAEIRAEYEANKAKYQTQTAVAISMIMLDPPESTSVGTVAERAEAIATALKEGNSSFADLARKYSCDSKAINGGSWGKVNLDDRLHKDVVAIVNRLKPGQISPLIMLGDYGYIVRKDEQQDTRTLTFEEAAPLVEGRLKIEKSEKLFKEWTGRLRNEAYVRILRLTGEK